MECMNPGEDAVMPSNLLRMPDPRATYCFDELGLCIDGMGLCLKKLEWEPGFALSAADVSSREGSAASKCVVRDRNASALTWLVAMPIAAAASHCARSLHSTLSNNQVGPHTLTRIHICTIGGT
eukprot:1160599-Pelagomonas_calceolata.AAC.5